MKKSVKTVLLLVCICLLVPTNLAGQEALDGRHRVFRDELLDNLVGNWKLTRRIRGQTVENSVKVEWVLNHQFMQIHMKDVNSPPAYEALVFIGYDNASERYVAHWLDVFGGRFSETLGYSEAHTASRERKEITMSRVCSITAALILLLISSASVLAKGRTTRIEIQSDLLVSPIVRPLILSAR